MYRLALIMVLNLCLCSSLLAEENKSIIFKEKKNIALSLPSLMFAVLQSPDYLELPLVLTKDDVPIVFNDIFLNPLTNVSKVFPSRSRHDGNYYAIDFTLAEIEQLAYREEHSNEKYTEHLASYDDALKVIERLKHISASRLKLIPVIKYPWFHLNENKDISSIIIDKTISHASSSDEALFLKSYDPDELQRIKKSYLTGLPVEVKLIQGVDVKGGRETMRLQRNSWVSYNYDWLFTRTGLMYLSGYAEDLSFADEKILGEVEFMRLISMSHELNMRVFVGMESSKGEIDEELVEKILYSLNADGIALSNPDRVKQLFTIKRDIPPNINNEEANNENQYGESTIFSDPEALSRRLQRVQQN